MKHHSRLLTVPLLLALLLALLSACGGAGAPSSQAGSAPVEMEAMPAPAAAESDATGGVALSDSAAPQSNQALPENLPQADQSRKIIKNADFSIEVESIDIGLSRLSESAVQYGGYVLETRTDDTSASLKSGLVRLAVPVEQFEAMLQRIRETGKRVISEQASGVDVTQEFVDVQSQLANLEATQARIRQFLEQATTVEEALRVNAELTTIEGQIGQLKGRIQFLSQRAAYSTITVQLRQEFIGTEPTPTPGWSPAKVAEDALESLTGILQAVATVAIWLVVVALPLLLPFALLALVLTRVLRRRNAAQTK